MAYDVFGNGNTAIKVNLSKYWQYAANDGVYIGDQPGVDVRADGQPVVDGRQRQFHSGLRSAEPAGPGQSRQRRRPLRRPGQSELLHVPADRVRCGHGDADRPGAAQRLGRPSVRLAVQRVGAAADRCRACRPRSASAGAGGGTSPSPTTAPSARRTSTSTRSPRRRTRVFPTSGQPVSYYLRNNRTAFGAVDNYLTLANNYGDMTAYWQGLELNVNARTNNGITRAGRLHRGGWRSRSLRRRRRRFPSCTRPLACS